MNEQELKYMIADICPPSASARRAAVSHWNCCAKPLGSLGLLEDAIADIAALTGTEKVEIFPNAVLVLCSDNGVVAQGVTQSGSEVTGIVAHALANGKSNINRMAQTIGCRVFPVDMGIRDFDGDNGVLCRRIGNGTQDITQAPAMTREQAVQAISTGIDLVREKKAQGYKMLATGEMGIGNTTTAAAVSCALLRRTPSEVVGRGAGLSDAGLMRKRAAVETALRYNQPDINDPIDVLAKVGGYDIAGLCGIFLGGAVYRVPILIDGAISAAAALCAIRLCPAAQCAAFATHQSAEPVAGLLLDAIGKKAIITADMRLGEGTGAVTAIPILNMALAVYQNGSTFSEYGMKPYTPQGDSVC